MLFLFSCAGDHRDLHSFPTRRSSDLNPTEIVVEHEERSAGESKYSLYSLIRLNFRSEEHTSELQSLRHLVCRLLLEKKKSSFSADVSASSFTTSGDAALSASGMAPGR